MNKEEKELLLKDLCARLQYGVKCTTNSMWDGIYDVIGYKDNRVYIDCPIYDEGDDEWLVESIKPFLRPMSSMTEEEKRELARITNSLIGYDEDCETLMSFDFYGDARLDVGMEIWLKAFDWLNKKMFAYRTYKDKNMFELGLAIPAPVGMYK